MGDKNTRTDADSLLNCKVLTLITCVQNLRIVTDLLLIENIADSAPKILTFVKNS